MFDRKMPRRALLAVLMGAALPWCAHAGFGFGFDSDNGFYDYDPEDYRWWGGYPPAGYRDYNPSWRWGSKRHSSGWRFGSRDDSSGWRWGDGKDSKKKSKSRKSATWWHSRKLKGDDGWSSWGREWSFGREGEPTKFNFGSFDFGDRWSPSFGKKSWSFGRKPRWRRPPPYYYAPPAYPAWGAPPAWSGPGGWGGYPQGRGMTAPAPAGGDYSGQGAMPSPAGQPAAGQSASGQDRSSKVPDSGSTSPAPVKAESKAASPAGETPSEKGVKDGKGKAGEGQAEAQTPQAT